MSANKITLGPIFLAPSQIALPASAPSSRASSIKSGKSSDTAVSVTVTPNKNDTFVEEIAQANPQVKKKGEAKATNDEKRFVLVRPSMLAKIKAFLGGQKVAQDNSADIILSKVTALTLYKAKSAHVSPSAAVIAFLGNGFAKVKAGFAVVAGSLKSAALYMGSSIKAGVQKAGDGLKGGYAKISGFVKTAVAKTETANNKAPTLADDGQL